MKTIIIAEAGVNHNGDKALAFELIDAAAEAGANMVKFQTYDSKSLATMQAPKAPYQRLTTNTAESQYQMLKKLELPKDWHFELKEYATKQGIKFISTAFDYKSLKFLETLDLPFYKIPSGEITNAPLLCAFARTSKKIILSTGMATLSEVEQALAILSWGYLKSEDPQSLSEIWKHWSSEQSQKIIKDKVTLLHCTSQYPTPITAVNLRAMETLSSAFDLPVGYSDHTEGILVPILAVSRGAVIIEKHFTLDRNLTGPDHRSSLEPNELKKMVFQIRSTELILGSRRKVPHSIEWDTRTAARQQIVATKNIKIGDLFTSDNIGTARTGSGISPLHYWDLVGSVSEQNYSEGDRIDG